MRKPFLPGVRGRYARVFLAIVFIISSCDLSSRKEEGHDAYLDEVLQRADLLVDSGLVTEAFTLIDSAYLQLEDISFSDQFRKYNFKRQYYLEVHQPEVALEFADSMLQLMSSVDPEDGEALHASANFLKGDVLFDQKKYSEAYEHYYKGKVIAEDLMDGCALSEYSYRLAMVCYKQGKYQESAIHFKEALHEAGSCRPSMWNSAFRQEQLCNIALSYANLNELDSAIAYYDQALRTIEKRKYISYQDSFFAQTAKGVLYGNVADVHLKNGDTATAEEALLKSVFISTQKGHDNRDGRFSQLKLANVYIYTNKLPQARVLLDIVGESYKKSPEEEGIVLWNKVSWHYYDKLGDTDKAYKYVQDFIKLKEAKTKNNRKLVNADASIEFKNLERAREVGILKRENVLKNAYLFIAAIFSLMGIVIILLIWLNGKRSKEHILTLTNLNDQVNVQNKQLALTLGELEESNKDKDRIMQVLAHDLRNPLAAISGISMLMLDAPHHIEEDREMLQMIKTSADTSANMITDILEVTLGIHSENMKKQEADIHQLLSQCVSLLQFKADDKNQTLTLKTDGPAIVLMNSEKMWRVFNNLITNAIKFSPSRTSINITARQNGKMFRICVQDSGIGIPEEFRDKIFDTFTSAKRYGTAGEQPFGLGLSISKQIVEAHGGTISFESKLNEGTTFCIEFPVSA